MKFKIIASLFVLLLVIVMAALLSGHPSTDNTDQSSEVQQ